jgi:hypothetical protein
MAAPTTTPTNGAATITATGEANGVLVAISTKITRPVLMLGVSGTFTSIVLAVRGRILGLTQYYPVLGRVRGSGAQISNSMTVGPTDSTAAMYEFDLSGCDYAEVYAVSGTPTDLDIEVRVVPADPNAPPLVVVSNASATTFGAGIALTGTTGNNDIVLTDNLASALDITESTNSYLNFVTTNSGEKCVFSKDVVLSGAIDLLFSGTTGQPEITLTDNLADALSVLIPSGVDLLVFTTTNSAEAVAVRGLRTTSTTATQITGATTLTLADSGGVFEIDQDAAFDIALPDPTTGPGCRYTFVISDAGANNVTVSTTGSSTFIGTIVNDVTSVVPATGGTLTFATGTAAVGDTIEAISISTSLYLIRAVSSAAGGITVA